MKNQLFKNWWLLTLKGLLAIVFGILLVSMPSASIILFMEWFGAIILVGGIFIILGSISHKKYNTKWKNWLFEGILDIIIGLVIIIFPQRSIEIFVIIIAIWAIIVGFTQLFSAMSLENAKKTRWLMFLNAMIVIIFAIVLFINPFESTVAITYMAGIFAIIFGLFIALYSFHLREFKE